MRPSMICPQRNAAQVEDENVLAEGIGKMDLLLHDSDVLTSAPTDTGSVSEDDTSSTGGGGGVGSWLLGGIIGVADYVHRFLQDENGSEEGRERLRLPWEIRHYHHDHFEQQEDGVDHDHNNDIIKLGWEEENERGQHQPSNVTVSYEEDAVLKEKIQALSSKEDTFLKPFTASNTTTTTTTQEQQRSEGSSFFLLDKPRIELVNRIWQVDEQLRATHARLSGRSNFQETVFWRNYFHHCHETRKCHLQQKAMHLQIHNHNSNNKTHKQGKKGRDDDDENNDDNGNDDESSQSSSSLVPLDDDDHDIEEDDDTACNDVVQESSDDDASFINIPTPPPSVGIRSVDSMVFIDDM